MGNIQACCSAAGTDTPLPRKPTVDEDAAAEPDNKLAQLMGEGVAAAEASPVARSRSPGGDVSAAQAARLEQLSAAEEDLETVPLVDSPSAAEPEPAKKAGAFDGAKQMYLNAQKAKAEKIAAERAATAAIANAPDPTKWVFKASIFSGSYTSNAMGETRDEEGEISVGIEKVKTSPSEYIAIMYQTEMSSWPADQQKYKLICRKGTKGFKPSGCADDGWMTCLVAEYQCLPPSVDLKAVSDSYTEAFSYGGQALGAPLLPGRGMGVCDVPGLKIIGDVDPGDVNQGAVGDCWMLSAISALAEFDGAVTRLFVKTPGIEEMPRDGPNTYTITLYDLATWEPVDVVVDERLASKADGSGLLGCSPSDDGELWPCYLEKAMAVHCGGGGKIDGGQCTHAWAMLTGCKEQYTINADASSGAYKCFGKYNPNDDKWETLTNSPHDGFRGNWPMKWPEAGGGGGMDLGLSKDELFARMCAWDEMNYIIGAGTKSGSDSDKTDGIVDGHAYTVISCVSKVAGTDFDLAKMRNPWGKGEFESGMWDDDGPGWTDHPEVKDALKPEVKDDGIFWVSKEEFFEYFTTIYLSASDMTAFKEDLLAEDLLAEDLLAEDLLEEDREFRSP